MPVSVKFECLDLDVASIPDLEGLAETFKLCARYWDENRKAKEFFKRAQSIAGQPNITAMRISDYNTTGLLGGDKDRTKNWYNLIRCSGSSSKGSGEGGSFGIGKNAPFAASLMRTVLYSTLNADGQNIFQGVARLVTHERRGIGIVQATGYLGGDSGGSVRDKRKIPKKYIRSVQGTDVIILGYEASATWSTDLIYSVLENFWPAVHFGDLEVTVGTTPIAKRNLQSLLDSYSSKKDFTAHLYYKAFTDKDRPPFTKRLATLRETSVMLLTGSPDLPKKVAMVRKTGMVIYQKQFRAVLPFCGVFLCRNDHGNSILREMEPPRHDEWDPDHPERGSHKRTAEEFTGYIRECIKELAPVDTKKILTIPELSQYLPDDDDSPEASFEGNPSDGLSKQEGFDPKPEKREITARNMDRKQHPQSSDVTTGEDDPEDDPEVESNGGGGGGSGDGTNSDKKKKGKPTGKPSKPPLSVRYRVFPTNLSTGTYSITVHLNTRPTGKVMLSVAAVGDDTVSPLAFVSAKLINGQEVGMPQVGKLGPVTFPQQGSLRLEVVLKEPERLAMEVEAHEA